MAVPAHDERDFEFAKQFGLPIRTVVRPPDEWLKKTGSTLDNLTEAYTEEGVAVNSGPFDGLPTAEFKKKITAWLEERGLGTRKVNYKLRDWLFSRQRYWGEPFPILHEIDADGKPTGVVEPLSPEELPLRLPELEDLQADGPAGAAAGQGDRLALRHAQRQALPPRDEHDAAVGRLVLVLPALPRPEERQGVLRSGKRRNTGCRSISTSAAPSTRCCTCSTRASGTRCSSTAATSTRRSRSRSWSTRA